MTSERPHPGRQAGEGAICKRTRNKATDISINDSTLQWPVITHLINVNYYCLTLVIKHSKHSTIHIHNNKLASV